MSNQFIILKMKIMLLLDCIHVLGYISYDMENYKTPCTTNVHVQTNNIF